MHRNYGIAGRPYTESRHKLIDRSSILLFGILLLVMMTGFAGATGAMIWWLFFR
jgi:hypothetical protein